MIWLKVAHKSDISEKKERKFELTKPIDRDAAASFIVIVIVGVELND
jgi:hypothetical protein